MSWRTKILTTISLTAGCLSAYGYDDYRCTIERVTTAQGDNSTSALSNKVLLGKEFTVERKSGLMAGALKNAYMTKPQVIDLGSKENAYKVVTTMRSHEGVGYSTNIHALNVQEYIEGPRKPFVYLWNDEVYFGNCEHF